MIIFATGSYTSFQDFMIGWFELFTAMTVVYGPLLIFLAIMFGLLAFTRADGPALLREFASFLRALFRCIAHPSLFEFLFTYGQPLDQVIIKNCRGKWFIYYSEPGEFGRFLGVVKEHEGHLYDQRTGRHISIYDDYGQPRWQNQSARLIHPMIPKRKTIDCPEGALSVPGNTGQLAIAMDQTESRHSTTGVKIPWEEYERYRM